MAHKGAVTGKRNNEHIFKKYMQIFVFNDITLNQGSPGTTYGHMMGSCKLSDGIFCSENDKGCSELIRP
jgi:hypothetical protein